MSAGHQDTLASLNNIVGRILGDMEDSMVGPGELKLLAGALKEVLDCRRMEELMLFKSEMEDMMRSLRDRAGSTGLEDTLASLQVDGANSGTVAEATLEKQ